MQLYSDLLSCAIHSIADSKEEKDLDTHFTGPKTTALVNPIAGPDDFELIAFLIVEDGNFLHPQYGLAEPTCTAIAIRLT